MRASDGEILKAFPSGGSSIAGAMVMDGRVYWGCGYTNAGFAPGMKVYAFKLKH